MATRQQTPNILDDLMSAAPAGVAKPAASSLRIAEIRRDGGTQPRAGLDEAHVQDLIAALAAGDELPPVDVVFDGTAYWLYDGFHRVEAHGRSGKYLIAAIIHQGTQHDAQWQSYAANSKHGLKRTNDDKRRQVIAALRHPNGASMSNREIARHVGVDESTVRDYRAKMEATAGIPQSDTRKGGDGRTINTSNIGSNRPTQPKRDDAAEDAWRPPGIGARVMQQQTAAPTGRPMIDVIRTDEEIAADAQAADIASRNAAADEAERQAQADPYDHTHGDVIRNDLAALESRHVAAAAAADVAFGMAPTRTQVLAKLLQDVMDAIQELSKLSGRAGDCIMLQGAAAKVYAGLVATAAPATTELPDDLKAHGWQLRQVRGKWIAFVQPDGEEEEIRTNIPREKLIDVIGDARYLDKQLKIGAA